MQRMANKVSDRTIEVYNHLKDILESTVETKVHQVRYTNLLKDEIISEIKNNLLSSIKVDDGM